MSATPILPAGLTFTPSFVAYSPTGDHVAVNPDAGGSASPTGLTPSQLRGAYGLGTYTWNSNTNSGTLSGGISFGGTPGLGAGETIAIIDAYDDPHALSDLDAFSAYYNLPGFNGPNEPTFQKLNENGGTSLPATASSASGWGIEESLDIEWAHAVAPLANIILFEADSAYDLLTAVQTAASTPGVVAVSMSWTSLESPTEQSADADFVTPPGHPGVTFLAAAGDNGAYASLDITTITAQYPAASPNVVAVGGTTLGVDANNCWSNETVWGSGTASWSSGGGGGGGISAYEPQPSYQTATVGASFGASYRAYPDVSADGNPNTGVPIYDSFDFGSSTPWARYGGTSLATPLWAALIAIADQGRALAGDSSLDGASQTLPMLYSLPASDFHDITSGGSMSANQDSTGPSPYTYDTPAGTNPSTFTVADGFTAEPGYDLTSGIGSPVANLLVPALVTANQLVFAQQPANGLAGAAFASAITVDVENSSGAIDTGDDGCVTLAIGTNPSGGNLIGTRTVQAVNGVATFSGLSIDTAGSGYTLVASLGALPAATSATFKIAANAAQPIITSVAAAAPAPVTGKTVLLTVQASDPNGQTLTYTWSAVSLPSGAAAPTFSVNGAASASTTTAMFSAAGTYDFTVAIANSAGFTATSSVAVVVNQTLTTIAIQAGALAANGTIPYTAVVRDQFGNAVATPAFTWSLAGGALSVAAGNQVAMTGPIDASSLAVTNGGETAVVTPDTNGLSAVDVASGTLVVQSPSTLAAVANVTVGNAAVFTSSSSAAVGNIDVSSGKLVVQDASSLAAGANLTVGNETLFAPVVAPAEAAPVSSAASAAPSATAAAPAAAARAFPAAAVLTGPVWPQSNREQSPAFRAVNAVFARCAR